MKAYLSEIVSTAPDSLTTEMWHENTSGAYPGVAATHGRNDPTRFSRRHGVAIPFMPYHAYSEDLDFTLEGAPTRLRADSNQVMATSTTMVKM